jgi:hypothetical protein
VGSVERPGPRPNPSKGVSRFLTDEAWAAELAGFRYTAFRLEQQREYWEPDEEATIKRFLAGDPQPPTEVPYLVAWFDQVARQVSEGKRIGRVRVVDEPPTPQQRWERWIDRWNTEAGEVIRYLPRSRAHEVGLLPAAGPDDWWLLDSSRLMVMRFDDAGKRYENELIDDPERLVQACIWRDLAVHYSTLETRGEAA